MIFITGGNFQFLDASAPIYEAERFVNTTNTVLVFIQYRLGRKKISYRKKVLVLRTSK
jgi:carboxylesterase type B